MEEAIIEDVFMQIQITLYILGLFEHNVFLWKYISNTTSKSWFLYDEYVNQLETYLIQSWIPIQLYNMGMHYCMANVPSSK